MMIKSTAVQLQTDTWRRAGVFHVRLRIDVPAMERSLRELSGTGRAGNLAAITNRIIHQSFTDLWRTKWAATFERRWYSRVTRRTGLSGQTWALARGTRSGTTWDYAVSNATDYSEHVHPSGRPTPLFDLEVPLWVAGYARDVEKEIAQRLRIEWRGAVQDALREAIARRAAAGQARRTVMAGRLRAALASRLGR